MPGSQSKKAIQRRNKRRKQSQAKAAKLAAKAKEAATAQAAVQAIQDALAHVQQAQEEPEECAICCTPFCKAGCWACPESKCTDWNYRHCECPEPKICKSCVVELITTSVERCCTSTECNEMVVKCPWCRNKVFITEYHNRIEAHIAEFPDGDERPPINAHEFWSPSEMDTDSSSS